jgi:uncharacterized membrane protein
MDDFFSVFFKSGHVAHLIMMVMMIEGLVLTIIAKRSKHHLRPSRIVMSLAAGFALVFALRAALIGQGWQWMALALIASFAAHLIDLYWRWTDDRC